MATKNVFCGAIVSALLAGTSVLHAQIAPSGRVELPAETLGLIVFDGVSVEEDVGFASVDFQMTHSLVTGQISGIGSMRMRDVLYEERYISASVDLDGSLVFSAKPVKRGSVVSLSGAKITAKTTGSANVSVYDYGTWSDYSFDSISNPTFSFRYLTAAIQDSGILLSGEVARGSLAIAASGYVGSQQIKRNVKVPYSEASFSTRIPYASIAGLDVSLSNLVQNSKGAVSGIAGSLFTGEDRTGTNGYKVAGPRSTKTGVSKLTLTGMGTMKGTSAVLNVDDSLQLKQGKGFANTLRAFGYSVSF